MLFADECRKAERNRRGLNVKSSPLAGEIVKTGASAPAMRCVRNHQAPQGAASMAMRIRYRPSRGFPRRYDRFQGLTPPA